MKSLKKSLLELSPEKYYKSAKSPWIEKERDFWKLFPGTRHQIDLCTTGDHYGNQHQPYSQIKIVMDNEDNFQKYSDMKESINKTYKELSKDADAKILKSIHKQAYIVFLVKHHDKEAVFCRGRVLFRVSHGIYRVYAYDDDVVYTVKQEDMFKAKLEFFKLRPLVVSVFLEGLEHMQMFPAFNKIVKSHMDPEDAFDFVPSPRDLRLFKKHTVGTFYNSKQENVNVKIAREFFGQPCAMPELKNINARCRITFAWVDGTVAVQFRLAFLDQIKYTLEGLKRTLKAAAEKLSRAPSITIHPDTTYAVGVLDPNDQVTVMWKRAEIIGDDKRVVSADTVIDCSLIDYGYKLSVKACHMILLEDHHPFLHLIPMQSTLAQLAFVKKLDAKKFMAERVFREPSWIVVQKPTESENDFPHITLYTRGIPGSSKYTTPGYTRSALCLMFASQIAEPTDPEFGITPNSKKTMPSAEREGIRMKKLNDFLKSNKIAPEVEGIDVGCKIRFTVIEARSETTFVIQTLKAPKIFRGLEPTGRTTGGTSASVKPYNARPVTINNIFAGQVFYHPCAELLSTLRVKICEPEIVDSSPRASVNVLCVDYAVYKTVAIDELIIPPFVPWEHGPQAAVVTHSELEAIPDMVGKRFTGIVSDLKYDKFGVALIRLDSFSVMEIDDRGKAMRRVMIDYTDDVVE